MTEHRGEIFTGDVELDGQGFTDCTFAGATLIFSGDALPTAFVNCTFNDVTVSFRGSADTTVRLLRGFATEPGSIFAQMVYGAIYGGQDGPRRFDA